MCRGRYIEMILVTIAVVVMTAVSTRVCAQEIAIEDTLINEEAVLAADTMVNNDPEWYVAPVDRVIVRAPKRAAAGTCTNPDSIQTYDENGNLAHVSIYEYGDTTRTMIWTVNPDGSRFGSSRTEEGTNGNITFSATYDWDATAGDWKGTNKEEHTYTGSRETLRTLYDWVNGAWSAKTQYAWTYDAAGRELEYTAKDRNASGKLAYSKQRLHEYNVAGKTLLEINYTAHNGSDWSAGTKRIYDYDGNNTILNEYYSAYTNGAWVGSSKESWVYTAGKKTYYEKDTWSNSAWVGNTKEVWEFNGPSSKQTLHEKYSWGGGDWSITLQENSGYDAAGNNNAVENYSYTNGVKKGSKKEAYTFSGTTKVETVTYKWTNNAWVENIWTVNNKVTKPIEYCRYSWNASTSSWVGTGERTLTTNNSSSNPIDVITQTWSSDITNWVNKSRKTTEYQGVNTTQEASYAWSTEANGWIGVDRSDWHYNAKGLNDTIKTYTNNGADWIYSNRTVKTYNAAGEEIMVHNAEWQNDAWVMTSMTRADIKTDEANRQTLYAAWHCSSDSIWIGDQVDSTKYTQSGKVAYRFHGTSWADGNWVPSYKIEYEYDDAERVLSQEQKEWVKNAWQGYYRYEYKYDAEGRQTAYASYNGWSDVYDNWIGTSKTGTVYDSQGLIVESSRYTWKNNDWLSSQKSSYAYDSQKRMILYILQSYVNGEWVNASKNEKGFCGDVISKDNTYVWLNGEWSYQSRNEQYYDEDAQAKLRREVLGSWSSGTLTSFEDNNYFYSCDPRYHTIRFLDEDGTLLETKQVAEGVVPSYDETPTKVPDTQHEYTFTNWSPEVVAATGDATYTAIYTATTRKYMITWLNDDNSQIDQTEVEYGVVPTHANPTKENTAEYSYEFTGWDVTPVAVTGTATYKATFSTTKNKYQITWLNDDNTQIDQTEVEYGVVPTHADATKQNTAEWMYEFTGWDVEPVAVTGTATYKATFSTTKNKYMITWLNDDNSQIDQTEVEYGVVPTHADPTKENTPEYSYEFTGWDVEPVAVTGVATYKATFSATKNKYQITWLNDDNTQIDQTEVEYGVVPTHANPTKENTAEYTYEFTGWDVTPVAVTGTATYKATFSTTKNKYMITWLNDDNTQIDQTEVEYGVVPTHADPTKENTPEYSYEFTGWDVTPVAVTGTATYKATFNATKNKYMITWLMDDGSVIDQAEVEYGSSPAHANINKENTAKYTYTFKGWSPEVSSVTGEASYIAQFDSVINKYTVTFYFEDGVTVIKSVEIAYGEVPSIDITPSRVAEEHCYYVFAGWSPEITEVTGDASYAAIFNKVPKEYEILFKDWNGTQLLKANVAYGTVPEYTGATPERKGNAHYSYTFTGWSPELTEVTGNATYTAVYETVVNMYTVRFLDEDGTELENQLVAYGVVPEFQGETPTKEDDEEYRYTFAGWSPRVTAVTSDAVYYATYTAHKKTEGFESITDHQSPITNKIMIDGRIYIIRGGHTYTTDGIMVE